MDWFRKWPHTTRSLLIKLPQLYWTSLLLLFHYFLLFAFQNGLIILYCPFLKGLNKWNQIKWRTSLWFIKLRHRGCALSRDFRWMALWSWQWRQLSKISTWFIKTQNGGKTKPGLIGCSCDNSMSFHWLSRWTDSALPLQQLLLN